MFFKSVNFPPVVFWCNDAKLLLTLHWMNWYFIDLIQHSTPIIHHIYTWSLLCNSTGKHFKNIQHIPWNIYIVVLCFVLLYSYHQVLIDLFDLFVHIFQGYIKSPSATAQQRANCEHNSGDVLPWWRHQIETFVALLAICAGNSPVTGEFPTQRPERERD